MIRDTLNTPVAEGDSALLTFYLETEEGAYIPLLALSALSATIYDEASGTLIGAWNERSILNANGGTVTEVLEAGITRTRVRLQLAPTDHPILDVARLAEWRIVLLKIRWSGGARGVNRELAYLVTNLQRVP